MHNVKRTVQATLFRINGWYKGLAPFIGQTISLQRPIKNSKIRRDTQCSGVDEYRSLNINGHRQWLRIRGENPKNPIILYLHGGPGGSQIPSYRHYQLGWESDFTIVHWEQRGAGKSWSRTLDPTTLTIDQLVQDGLEIIQYLASRFGRSDIILLGHSWGTLLGVHLLQANSSNISAYVGIGQVANLIETEQRMYRFALDSATKDNNHLAKAQLEKLSGYPLAKGTAAKVAHIRHWARHYGYLGSNANDTARTYLRLMETPEYSLLGIYRFLQGTLLSSRSLGTAMLTIPQIQPNKLPKTFQVPMFFISGKRDHFTPAGAADAYLESINAPAKKHILFATSGHYPNEDEPERFIATLDQLVGPYLHSSTRGADD